MADKVLITLDDLETAVPLNAAFEGAGFPTNAISALDDARSAVRREHPALQRPASHTRRARLW